MIESIEHVIRSAIRRSDPGSSGITILEIEQRGDEELSPWFARVSWTSDDLTRIEQLIVQIAEPDVASEQQALLEVLKKQRIPTPTVLSVEVSTIGAYLVSQYVPGVSMAQVFSDASMRWELSAHGFTFSRALARIHNIDWRTSVPWMTDTESLPEDLIDAQLDEWNEEWEDRFSRCPERYQGVVETALAWLEDHRPTEVSVSLCHGDFRPANVITANDEVAAVIGWEHALVTDASYDLALLPFEIREMGLPTDDADLLSQAIFGSYLQSSTRSLGNLQFYAVARLLTAGLLSFEFDEGSPEHVAAFSSDPDVLFDAMRQSMTGDRKALWKQ
jgi:aminoglycoside phosphotransferase (APT) family kinase protein